jgi:hypothetical protein
MYVCVDDNCTLMYGHVDASKSQSRIGDLVELNYITQGFFSLSISLSIASFTSLTLHHAYHSPCMTMTMAMTEDEFSEEEVLSHLSRRPRYILNGVISFDQSAKPTFPEIRREDQSSVGVLGNLPLELLRTAFN